MNTPAASVLMCVYNEREDFLRRALDSLLEQTFGDFELVLIDDGSDRPETVRVLAEYAARDGRVRLFRKANEGLTRSLNFGLRQCAAEIVFRHDSDDWSDAWRLGAQLYYLQRNPDVALVGTGYHYCLEDGSIHASVQPPLWRDEIMASLPRSNPFCHGSVAFRRSVVERLGGYRETLRCAQDYDLFWRIAEEYPVSNLPEPLYHHRRTATCVTASKTLLQDRCVECLRELARMRRERGVEDFERAWALSGERVECPRGRMRALVRGGDQMLFSGRYRSAAAQYLGAVRAWPWDWRVYAKLARLALCLFVPFLRHDLFLAPRTRVQPQGAA